MIRESKNHQKLVEIWYAASVEAHGFIPRNYWDGKKDDMANIYLPQTRNFEYVDEHDNITGFISLNNSHIEAIFVSPECQRQGIGSALLGFVMQHYERLTLQVYEKNTGSIEFYRSHGFVIVEETRDENTGEMQYEMVWNHVYGNS